MRKRFIVNKNWLIQKSLFEENCKSTTNCHTKSVVRSILSKELLIPQRQRFKFKEEICRRSSLKVIKHTKFMQHMSFFFYGQNELVYCLSIYCKIKLKAQMFIYVRQNYTY